MIDSLLRKNKVCDIIHANFMIGELKDTTYIDTLFKNINDVRICPGAIHFKGQSVYQSKVIALKKITNKDSMLRITRKPDTLIINYFKHFFRK